MKELWWVFVSKTIKFPQSALLTAPTGSYRMHPQGATAIIHYSFFFILCLKSLHTL